MLFAPFNPLADVAQLRRNLPHWRQTEATYFVTFRLADSLPREVLTRLAELRAECTGADHHWIDRFLDTGTGECLLGRPEVGSLMESVLRHFDGTRYALGDFVVMPNHVHALLQVGPGHQLSQVLHSWKSYSARELQRARLSAGRVWQDESFDRIVRSEYTFREYENYIRHNPAEAGLRSGFVQGCGTLRV